MCLSIDNHWIGCICDVNPLNQTTVTTEHRCATQIRTPAGQSTVQCIVHCKVHCILHCIVHCIVYSTVYRYTLYTKQEGVDKNRDNDSQGNGIEWSAFSVLSIFK